MARWTFRIATLGCKVNQQESEALAARFEALGFLPAQRGEAADVCVVNSCTVTSMADSKTRQRIRQARAGSPGALVCVIGCLPEVRREEVLSMPEVDLVVGSLDKERTAELALEALDSKSSKKLQKIAVVNDFIAKKAEKRGKTAKFGLKIVHNRKKVPKNSSITGFTRIPASLEISDIEGACPVVSGGSFGAREARAASQGDGSFGAREARAASQGDGSFGAVPRESASSRTRAFIKAEDGCDRFCAYCVIPYARGAVRSRPMEEVLAEAEALLAAGYKELVLTGINLALYGRDFPVRPEAGQKEPSPLCSLEATQKDPSPLYSSLEATQKEPSPLCSLVEGLCSLGGGGHRVRLGSLEPTVIDARDAVRLAGIPGVCPQFHLSLQSGSERTLAAMGRGYTPEKYAGIVRALRGVDPLFSLTTDVIVGFPGETEADFEESLRFVRGMGFVRVHVFKYSKRPGTRAAVMGGQVPEAVKNARSRLMIQAAGEGAARFLAQNEGCARQALVLGPDKSGRYVRGLTDNGIDVALPVRDGGWEPNTFVEVELKAEHFL